MERSRAVERETARTAAVNMIVVSEMFYLFNVRRFTDHAFRLETLTGNRMAMHNLAALYAGGGLGTQQFDAAAKWFEEAANRGMKDSQFNLGMLYARGLGVKQDLGASFVVGTISFVVATLSMIAVVYTSLVALVQTDMKKLIAYSSVAHMAIVTIGLFAFNQAGLEGAMMVMLGHGLVSGALFLCVGVIYDRLHTREIARYGGLSINMP